MDGGDGGDAFVLFNVRDAFFAVAELVLEDAVLPFLGHGVLFFGGDVSVDGLSEELCMVAERLVRVGHGVVCLEDEILEEHDGRDGVAPVVEAVFVRKLVAHEGEVHEVVELPKDVAFRDEPVIEVLIFAYLELLAFL